MAQRTEIRLIDDVDGTAATQTVQFALDGRDLEIDLNDKNAAKLRKAFDPYVGAARRLGSRTGTSRRRTLTASSSGMTKEELANVRAWARSNGYEVADRGRIKHDIIEAYHAAH
ncbi:MAG: Lsr2 family protein [Mycetocola sp.]